MIVNWSISVCVCVCVCVSMQNHFELRFLQGWTFLDFQTSVKSTSNRGLLLFYSTVDCLWSLDVSRRLAKSDLGFSKVIETF